MAERWLFLNIMISILLLGLLKCVTSLTTPMTPNTTISEHTSKLRSTTSNPVLSKNRRNHRKNMRYPEDMSLTTSAFAKMDDPYEPYWKGGDLVYYRKLSTNRPLGYFLNTGTTHHPECNQICTKLYKDYGEVCGQRLIRKTWVYEYKDFKDMCHLQLENCYYATKRLGWYPIRQGKCHEVDISTHPTATVEIVSRMMMWESLFPGQVYDPNLFVTTTLNPFPFPFSQRL